MEGKKICFVCPWMNNSGGLQRVVTNLANMFSVDNTVTMCIISKYDESPYYPLNRSIKIVHLTKAAASNRRGIERLNGKLFNYINCPSIYMMKKTYYPRWRVDELYCQLLNESYDYVIASCGDLALLLSQISRKNMKSSLIGWQHNSYDVYFRSKGKYYYGRERLAKISYPNLNALICLTQKDAEKYKKRMGVNNNCIYNPLSFQCYQKANLLQKNIVFVGRLAWEQKGLKYLSQIIDCFYLDLRSSGWTVTIVGDGDGKKKLQDCFLDKDYRNQIRFTGQTSDVIKYYTSGSICINTSKWEGFGLVITEAMECGLPVVSFETDGPSEIIQDGGNGFLIPCYDIHRFANRLLVLAEDFNMRSRMGVEAVKTAKRFSSEIIFQQWEEMLLKL